MAVFFGTEMLLEKKYSLGLEALQQHCQRRDQRRPEDASRE